MPNAGPTRNGLIGLIRVGSHPAIGGHFTRSCIASHFTCGPGGGAHAAALPFLAANRHYRWRLHLDIRRYFPSISHPILEHLLAPATEHPDLGQLIRQILDSGDSVYRSNAARQVLPADALPLPPRTGLPLGSYFSQWSGGWYLNGLDHYVKRELKLPGYLRYMDDFVLFDHDRQRLSDAQPAIRDWLARERALSLNPRHRQIEPSHHPAVFVGWRISRAGLAPSRRLRRRLRARLAAAARQGPAALQRTLSAYRGLLWIP